MCIRDRIITGVLPAKIAPTIAKAPPADVGNIMPMRPRSSLRKRRARISAARRARPKEKSRPVVLSTIASLSGFALAASINRCCNMLASSHETLAWNKLRGVIQFSS